MKVWVEPVLPGELRLTSASLAEEIPEQGEISGSFEFSKDRALAGSRYVLFLSARAGAQGARIAKTTWVEFEVPKIQGRKFFASMDQAFAVGLFSFILLGLAGMWWAWIRPLQRLKQQNLNNLQS
jgi:hypothetical protein